VPRPSFKVRSDWDDERGEGKDMIARNSVMSHLRLETGKNLRSIYNGADGQGGSNGGFMREFIDPWYPRIGDDGKKLTLYDKLAMRELNLSRQDIRNIQISQKKCMNPMGLKRFKPLNYQMMLKLRGRKSLSYYTLQFPLQAVAQVAGLPFRIMWEYWSWMQRMAARKKKRIADAKAKESGWR
jgi:hypothetical protein